MKRPFIIVLAALMAAPVPATTLGLAPITYPVYLPYNAEDEEIELRQLPFATRSSHPELIGAALSAPYVVPTDDKADLPKNINLINVCKITVKTDHVAIKRETDDPVGVNLTVDITKFAKPDYVPFEDAAILRAVARAISRTLATSRLRLENVTIVAADGQVKLRKILEKRLPKPQFEAAGPPEAAD